MTRIVSHSIICKSVELFLAIVYVVCVQKCQTVRSHTFHPIIYPLTFRNTFQSKNHVFIFRVHFILKNYTHQKCRFLFLFFANCKMSYSSVYFFTMLTHISDLRLFDYMAERFNIFFHRFSFASYFSQIRSMNQSNFESENFSFN